MSILVKLSGYYWDKESTNLFDYDADNLFVREFNILSNTIIIKKERELLDISEKFEFLFTEKNFCEILHFLVNKDNASVTPIHNVTDKSFLTVKHTFQGDNVFTDGYKLKVGDILKLGKMNAVVKELNIITNDQINQSKAKEKTVCENLEDHLYSQEENLNLILRQNLSKKKKNHICRFCLCEDNENSNPLITPCKCSGTMKYIHIDCLKNWLKSKITIKNIPHMISYSFKQLHCELCLSPVPIKFKVKNDIFNLIDMEKPDCTYIIIEQQAKEDQEKTLYLIIFKDRTILRMGRSNDCDVKLNDISVSRHHCNLALKNGVIYLEDNRSKFGTLVYLDHLFKLILNKQIGIQHGKHLFIITLTRTFCSTLLCAKIQSQWSNYNDYMTDLAKRRKKTDDYYLNEQKETFSHSISDVSEFNIVPGKKEHNIDLNLKGKEIKAEEEDVSNDISVNSNIKEENKSSNSSNKAESKKSKKLALPYSPNLLRSAYIKSNTESKKGIIVIKQDVDDKIKENNKSNVENPESQRPIIG